MKLTSNTLNIFNRNLQKTAEDRLTERTPEKIAFIRLMSAHFTDTLRALHNGSNDEKIEASDYIKSLAFNRDCTEFYGIKPVDMLRMLLYVDNDIKDVDKVSRYDDLPEVLED